MPGPFFARALRFAKSTRRLLRHLGSAILKRRGKNRKQSYQETTPTYQSVGVQTSTSDLHMNVRNYNSNANNSNASPTSTVASSSSRRSVSCGPAGPMRATCTLVAGKKPAVSTVSGSYNRKHTSLLPSKVDTGVSRKSAGNAVQSRVEKTGSRVVEQWRDSATGRVGSSASVETPRHGGTPQTQRPSSRHQRRHSFSGGIVTDRSPTARDSHSGVRTPQRRRGNSESSDKQNSLPPPSYTLPPVCTTPLERGQSLQKLTERSERKQSDGAATRGPGTPRERRRAHKSSSTTADTAGQSVSRPSSSGRLSHSNSYSSLEMKRALTWVEAPGYTGGGLGDKHLPYRRSSENLTTRERSQSVGRGDSFTQRASWENTVADSFTQRAVVTDSFRGNDSGTGSSMGMAKHLEGVSRDETSPLYSGRHSPLLAGRGLSSSTPSPRDSPTGQSYGSPHRSTSFQTKGRWYQPTAGSVAMSSSPSRVTTQTPTRTSVGVQVSSLLTSASSHYGIIGLRNLGNTCFMNSMLQCLAHTPEMTNVFLQARPKNSYGMVRAYKDLLQEMWGQRQASYYNAITPSTFKSRFSRDHPRFSGYGQHDAQEFMRFLVSSLHEELRRESSKEELSTPRPPTPFGMSDDAKGEKDWRWYMTIERSPVAELFVGQLRSTLTCSICGTTSTTFDPFWDLQLPLPKRVHSSFAVSSYHSDAVELTHCLDTFTSDEVLDGDEKPSCRGCRKATRSFKRMTINHSPKILVLHLKRFSGWNVRTKLETPVNIPQHLDLSKFTSSGKGKVYELYATSNHVGNVYTGHYTAWVKHHRNGMWYTFNDSSVTKHGSYEPTSKPSFQSSQAYVLFYRQTNGF